jgi:FKBP-type peptidyl-prolyl cis-trans isomerase
MKQTTRRTIQGATTGAILLSLASLAGAQNTSTPPAPPQGRAQGQQPGGPAAPAPTPALTNEQASYLFGLTLGESLHGIGLSTEVLPDQVAKGVKDAMTGKRSTPQQRQQVQEFARASMQASAGRNKTAADEFLAKNGKKEGVQTTATGLQYKIIKAGDSKAPLIAATDTVTVNYSGKLIDGTEFDSSYTRGQPAEFPANGVIKGWQEALLLMRPGSNYQLFVPPDLAYGANPRPGIPANSLLIFNVDVISAKPKAAAAPPAGPGHAPASAPGAAGAKPSTPQ